jgi:hypothetical protein
VAGAFLGRSIPEDFTYFLIDEDVLLSEGFSLKSTKAKTFDNESNDCHVDIVEVTGKQLVKLARLLNTTFDPIVITRTEILEATAKYLRQGKFDRNFLFTSGGNKGRSEEEITMTRKLLVELWKKSLVDVQV